MFKYTGTMVIASRGLLPTLAFLILVGLMLSMAASTTRASALSGSQFRAGRIIDDAVFYNKNAMSANKIQEFLNSKVPTCATHRTKSTSPNDSGPPYTCLKNYKTNTTNIAPESGLCDGYTGASNESAATIIYKVAQSCGINPQVILVMLQKEQSLVTDTWPWDIQYQKAMGAFCPDTAPCDSGYAGFFKQVYFGAHRFKVYAANPDSFNYKAGRNNSILWHPNTSCGRSTVFIENQATASLYIYTPYRPNRAALNNLYGTGDGCSSYGNRNFWRIFNDWFGSTHGTLWRTKSSPTLYFIDGEVRHTIPSMEIINQYGFGLGDVRYVSQSQLDSIPLAASPLSSGMGQIVKSPDDSDADGGALYLISNGRKHQFTSMGQLTSFGFSPSDIRYMSLAAIQRIQDANRLSNFARTDNDKSVFFVSGGQKQLIFTSGKLNSLNSSGKVSYLSPFTLHQLKASSPLEDGDYLTRSPDGSIRIYNGPSYFRVPSMAVYGCWGLASLKQYSVNDNAKIGGLDKGNLNCFAKNSSGSIYAMATNRRFQLASSQNLPAPSSINDSAINRIPLVAMKPVIKAPNSPRLSVIENNIRRDIPSMEVFHGLGYSKADIDSVPSALHNSFRGGPKKLSTGALVKSSTGKIYVISSLSTRLHVTTPQQFNDYAFKWPSLINASQTDLEAYKSAGSLSMFSKINSEVFLVDGGTRFKIQATLDSNLGIVRTNLPSIDERILQNTKIKEMSRFIKSKSGSEIYHLENGKKRHITSWNQLGALGGNPTEIVSLSKDKVSYFPTVK